MQICALPLPSETVRWRLAPLSVAAAARQDVGGAESGRMNLPRLRAKSQRRGKRGKKRRSSGVLIRVMYWNARGLADSFCGLIALLEEWKSMCAALQSRDLRVLISLLIHGSGFPVPSMFRQ